MISRLHAAMRLYALSGVQIYGNANVNPLLV